MMLGLGLREEDGVHLNVQLICTPQLARNPRATSPSQI